MLVTQKLQFKSSNAYNEEICLERTQGKTLEKYVRIIDV